MDPFISPELEKEHERVKTTYTLSLIATAIVALTLLLLMPLNDSDFPGLLALLIIGLTLIGSLFLSLWFFACVRHGSLKKLSLIQKEYKEKQDLLFHILVGAKLNEYGISREALAKLVKGEKP